eukprot:COSAG01_NODE_6825_length_3482_cov_3.105528_2_plen_179_part_00
MRCVVAHTHAVQQGRNFVAMGVYSVPSAGWAAPGCMPTCCVHSASFDLTSCCRCPLCRPRPTLSSSSWCLCTTLPILEWCSSRRFGTNYCHLRGPSYHPSPFEMHTYYLFQLLQLVCRATNIHDTLHGDTEPIMGSKYHLIHHTHYNRNYGQFFIVCDWLWGTLDDGRGKGTNCKKSM